MKRSSVEPWIENVGETGCLEPAFKQNTNDEGIILSIYKKIKSCRFILFVNDFQ